MGKLWRHSGRKPSNEPVKTEIDLNAFSGYCYVCKENVYRATHCPKEEVKNSEVGGIEGILMETAINVCTKDTRKVSVGNCQRMKTKDLLNIKQKPSMETLQ